MSEPSTTSQEPVSQAEFARIIGMSKQRVSQLKKAGRLVMDGGLVVVDASRASIKQSEDQRRDDVRLRHAEERAEKLGEAPPVPMTPEAVEVVRRRAEAIMRKEEAAAELKEIEVASASGELVRAEDVHREATETIIVLRKAIESIPVKTAPQLATMGDRAEIQEFLSEMVEYHLNAAAHNLRQVANKQ